ncbi:ATP-binding cassette domain-containing protein [Nocardia arthritidis]|uniref:ATP-binding cassette domain-containing protein n=1 Tax=Nocardia arthritidis TaxID=228602 RepID=UPI003D162126
MLGPNGAGKSTLTRICTTLSRASSGSARVAGYGVNDRASDVRRCVGYVSQGSGADPRLTPRENLVMAARLRGLSRQSAHARAGALLNQFQLDEARDRKVAKLSGGMRRKLDVAIGLVHCPTACRGERTVRADGGPSRRPLGNRRPGDFGIRFRRNRIRRGIGGAAVAR